MDNRGTGQFREIVDRLYESSRQYPGYVEELKNVIAQLRQYVETSDENFIGQLLFPEFYPPARLPTRFSTPTAAFSVRDHFYVDPNVMGNFSIIFFPKAMGPTGYVFLHRSDVWTESSWGPSTMVRADQINEWYDSVRLVAATIKLTYMGSNDEMSGVLVGSIDYGYNTTTPNVDRVEEANYVQRSKTVEGLRLIWFHKDTKDTEFVPTTSNAGDQSQAILIYGTALPMSPGNKLRCDVERHFEGIPNHNIRDYVEVKKAAYNENTLKALDLVHERLPQLLNVKPSQLHEMHRLVMPKLSALDQVLETILPQGRGGLLHTLTGEALGSSEVEGDSGLEAVKKTFTAL